MYPVSLKISGFKSFAEPASLFFSLGVSAVVGPNGCGKSNIIEALRWVMGEGSARRLRSGSDMEEVIFAGSKERPPFSRAEVTLQLESVKGASPQELHPMATNAERADNNSKISGQKGVGLLAQLRGEERISISRRIESGGGSSYRINGKEALARDVQTLCADMGLGANASALVGQGQIAELVNAKPLERRLLIEEAAGVRGLYSRRSDALSGLENTRETLARVEEHLQEDAKRLKSLEQESSRAERYRELSKQIKRLRAAELAREDSALEARLESLRARVDKLTLSRDSSQALLAELDAQIAEAQEKCRIASEKELESAAHCQRLGQEIALLERSYLDLEEKQRGLEQRRVAELRSHGEQEQALVAAEQLWRDALAVIATSESSVVESGTKANTKEQNASEKQASDRLAQIDTELVAFEKQLTGLGGKLRELERQGAIYAERLEVSRKQKERIELELAKLSRELQRGERVNNDANNNESSDGSNRESQNESKADNDNLAKLSTELSAEIASLESSNEERQRKVLPNLRRLEDELVKRRESLHSEHLSLSTRLQAECDKQRDRLRLASSSLTELDDGEQQQAGRLLLSELKVPPDLSLALFGALGDDLFASLHKSNIRYWLALASPENGSSPPPLPAGISSLASLLELPSALRKVLERRLEQIGLVSTQAEGASLQGSLREGQRLVSRDGSSWRWDGLQSGAGVAVAAEQRYQSFLQWNALKRGLAKSEEALQKAKRDYATACSLVSDKLHQTHDDYQTALADEKVAIERLQDLRRLLRATESRVREQEQQKSRVAQLNLDLGTSIETGRVAAASLEELAQRPELERQRGELEQRRQGLLEERAGLLAERRRASEQLAREQEDQRARVDNEQRLRSLKDKNSQVLSHIVSSVRDIEGQLASLSLRPARDLRELDTSRKQHRAYETRRAQDKNAFERLNKLLADKQERRRKESLRITELDKDLVRLQTQGEHLPAEREQLEARSQEELSCSVSDLRERYSLDVAFLSESLDIQKMARRSAMDKRARLGDINFAARQTLAELKADHEQRQQQQRDVSAALSRLSLSVRKLEAEASSKLSRVLEEVGACFSTFIARLFGGGEGQIFFSDSSDPINSGLEISLSLPGKRIKSLSSMSGGEQALVAISLILSVFSVAGGKFCILDEVDAALDDGNVSRFCDLLDDISRSGSTRFLVITHHHYTMSRAVRLYGVAMPEPGCSSIVSVALEEALEHARVAAE